MQDHNVAAVVVAGGVGPPVVLVSGDKHLNIVLIAALDGLGHHDWLVGELKVIGNMVILLEKIRLGSCNLDNLGLGELMVDDIEGELRVLV